MELRYYQRAALDSVYEYLRKIKDRNPVVEIPTGGGKTPVLSTLCHDVASKWNGRAMVVSRQKELVGQTVDTLSSWYPDLSIGAYSAGLKKRDTDSDILVAGIQSIYRRACEISDVRPFNVVLVDECHDIPVSGDGMYRTLLNELLVINPKTRVVGFTATPFRTQTGWVCSDEHFLNDICYSVGIKELIANGFLSRLASKKSRDAEVDTSGVGVSAGEFKQDELSAAFCSGTNVKDACQELFSLTKTRKSVLVFTCGLEHMMSCATELDALAPGQVRFLHSGTASASRDRMIEDFKERKYKFLLNINVLTTGFDATCIDCVALFRSTLSPGLFAQMCGRGLRLDQRKKNCLILDYGGNIARHGTLDNLCIRDSKKKAKGGGEAPTKDCPECLEVVHSSCRICPECKYVFPRSEKDPHAGEAATESVIGDPEVIDILFVNYSIHHKRNAGANAIPTMRVDYHAGDSVTSRIACSEWICPQHSGFAGNKASHWWKQRSPTPMPSTTEEAVYLARAGALSDTEQIHVVQDGKYKRIVSYEISDRPPRIEYKRDEDETPLPSRGVNPYLDKLRDLGFE